MNDKRQTSNKIRTDIAFNYYEHFLFLFSDTPIKDKEQVVKTMDGKYRLMYKDSSGASVFCSYSYNSLDELERREKVRPERCFFLN